MKVQSGSPPPSPQSARGRAIVVGVSNYSSSRVTGLRYAARNAADVGNTLSGHGYGERLLTDQAATRAVILHEILHAAAALRDEDTLMLYFAGHGASDGSGSVLFASDSDPTQLSTGLAWEQILKPLAASRARHVLVVLDAS
ncbi:MAG: caspase family protein [Acidobacteriia bacterium]|nr:caspase family protein [Terriglobia bacterium]